jgi:Bacterial SH3 domain
VNHQQIGIKVRCRGHDASCCITGCVHVERIQFLSMAGGSDSGHDSEERDLETERLFPPDTRSDSATRAGDSTAADTRADAGDRIVEFEKAAFGVDNSPAFRTDTDDRTHAASGVVPATAEAIGEMPPARRSRKRVLVFAAIVVLLAVAAVGVIAGVGRNGGAKSSPRVAPPARSEASTSTTSRAEVTTTIAPAPAPSAPISFTVHSSCGGRDCAVAVRERPSTAAKTVRSLRSGEVVQITCSTHGDRIVDRDTGQQSDVWYRLAGTDGYSSALYLEGPTVQDCG